MYSEVSVKTSDFFKGQQEPRSLLFQEKWHEIVEIEDRWYEGYIKPTDVPIRYFRVRCECGKRFILRYNELFDKWAARKLTF